MANRIFRTAGFTLDPASRLLSRDDGHSVTLPARIFDCVFHLIEHRHRAVDRDELAAIVWNRSDVSDNMLAQLMTRTRRLLADTDEDRRIIRTVPGFGYQWVAPTRLLDRPSESQPLPEPPAAVVAPALTPVPGVAADPPFVGRQRRADPRLVTILVAAAIGLAVGLLGRPGPAPRPGAEPGIPVPPQARPLLVLPAIVGRDGDRDWLRLGVMALVGERLSAAGQPAIPADNVVALTRGMDVAGLGEAAYARLADAAAANRIVRAQVDPAGERWRVTLRIVFGDTASGLSVEADGEDPLDAARLAADRLAAGLGLDVSAPAQGTDPALASVLREAEAAYLGGHPQRAHRILTEAQSVHGQVPELSYQLALIEAREGRSEAAAAIADALIEASPAHDDPLTRARALNLRSSICYLRLDAACMNRHSQQALDLLQQRPDAAGELARAYFGRAMAASLQDRKDETLEDLATARTLWNGIGNRLGVARVDGEMGATCRQQGRIHEAVPLLERSADQLQGLHEARDEAISRAKLAFALLDLGEPGAALRQEARLGELSAQARTPDMRIWIDLIRAEILLNNGRLDAAHALIATSLPDLGQCDGVVCRPHAHSVAALHALARQQFALAEAEAEAALDGMPATDGDRRGVAVTYLLLARLRARHDPAGAEAVKAAFLHRPEPDPSHYTTLIARLIDAAIAEARHDDQALRAAFEDAFAIAAAETAPIDRLLVAEGFVPWLIEHGELVRAAQVVGRLGEMTRQHFDAAMLELRLYQRTGPPQAWQAAYDRARSLAGERTIPDALQAPQQLLSSSR